MKKGIMKFDEEDIEMLGSSIEQVKESLNLSYILYKISASSETREAIYHHIDLILKKIGAYLEYLHGLAQKSIKEKGNEKER